MQDHNTHTIAEDEVFDRELAALFVSPKDADVAELSRAVLSKVATANETHSDNHVSEVLSEPLPWALGFVCLIGIGILIGYILSSNAWTDGLLTWFAFGDILTILGGIS